MATDRRSSRQSRVTALALQGPPIIEADARQLGRPFMLKSNLGVFLVLIFDPLF